MMIIIITVDDGDRYLCAKECHSSRWFGFYFIYLFIFFVRFPFVDDFFEIEINFGEQMLILIKISTSIAFSFAGCDSSWIVK